MWPCGREGCGRLFTFCRIRPTEKQHPDPVRDGDISIFPALVISMIWKYIILIRLITFRSVQTRILEYKGLPL